MSHSANVELRLSINGSVLEVAQVGPNFLVLRRATVIEPMTEGELSIRIDNFERSERVLVHQGATADSDWGNFTRCRTTGERYPLG